MKRWMIPLVMDCEDIRCFGYIAECPLGLGYYTREARDKCYHCPECWKDWIESGGRLGYCDIKENLKEGLIK
jgi:hypothetical protein